MVKNLPANAGDTGFNHWVRKIPWKREWQLIPVFSPEKSHGQRSLVGSSPWGCRELNTCGNLKRCCEARAESQGPLRSPLQEPASVTMTEGAPTTHQPRSTQRIPLHTEELLRKRLQKSCLLLETMYLRDPERLSSGCALGK